MPGVISGIGKGIIGTARRMSRSRLLVTNGTRAFSLLVWPTPEKFGFKGHCDQDRSVSQYRCRYGWLTNSEQINANLVGTMSPREHGECFVLKGTSLQSLQSTHVANRPIDGGESDLDLGNYERYILLRYPIPCGCGLTLLYKVLGH